MQKTIKRQVFELIDPSHAYDGVSRAFNISMLILIFLNVLVVILETEEGLFSQYKNLFLTFDTISVTIFTIEYLLRLWTCNENPKYKSPVTGRLRYILLPSMLIDLISILPFFIPVWGVDLRIIRALRLFRLFRLLKMGRYSQSLIKMGNVIKSKKEELTITLFAGVILLIIASSLMYFIEHNTQPDAFSSIPAAMWWGAVTLTTVGYGDVYPKTVMGKLLAAIIAVLGIGLFALPAGIIASGFAAELQNKSSEPVICPHCGKDINSISAENDHHH
jgi:voltage-gated potassium channel